ncbi:MAG: nucleotidyl transferase AbiEii/AbiGii toxin family protein [Chitinispirillaceae bacterium]|nr:nucleotidyl transferase AbiEii/AbiGii toxin family protein [Chitinispirillaceae bacterium]
MIDNLRSFLAPAPPGQRANRLREYLQWLVLRSVDLRDFRKHLAFVGGTALRIVYGINRFSEDLDYSLIPGHTLSFRELTEKIQEDLVRLGLACSHAHVRDEKAVWSCFFRFSDLLYPLGLSANPAQKLSVKVEIDANPPEGGQVAEHFHNGPIMFSVNHHDLPSLFAGKLHALFFRPYVKGRDYYDLMFFLTRKVGFNLELLHNAARQTNPGANIDSVEKVMALLKNRIEKADAALTSDDLVPFLLQPEEIRYLTAPNFKSALEQNFAAGVFNDISDAE